MTVLLPSVSYSFSRTREQLRNKVLAKLRVLDPAEQPSAEDGETVLEAMELRLKEMHALGVFWGNVSAAVDLTLEQDAASVEVEEDGFLYPLTLSLRLNGDDNPIEIISHRQYQAIRTKTETGEPVQAYFAGSTCYLWPVPNIEYTARLTYQVAAADTATSGAPDIEVGMMRAFVVIVAADLVDDFHVEEPRAMRLQAEAVQAWRTIRALNTQRVDSTPVETTPY